MAAVDDLNALGAEVTRATTVDDSASTLIDGFAARLAAAAAAAIANGATAAQIKPVTDLGAALTAASDRLTASVIANTPAAPATP